ncbi:MAG: signal peptidase I [Chlamydiae bacterium]|nr:signal peptidase I [Chlamydiota bacterium]
MRRLFSKKHYSLKKSTAVLIHTFHLYKKKKVKLSAREKGLIESSIKTLQDDIMNNDKEKAYASAKNLEDLSLVYLKKNSLEKTKDTAITLVLALCAAVVIRQSWFELYEIPTGSMRPTLKEQDRLYVSKTTFGINIPLTTNHLLFNPKLVERNGIFVFTGQNMDIRDVDTKYFFIFPGKKQYIKRLMAKPGDTVYFYGGQMYGIDQDNQDISSSLQNENLSKIEHIPFIYPEGKLLLGNKTAFDVYPNVTIYQMNEPVARMQLQGKKVTGEMLRVCPTATRCPPPVNEYYELWGFKNFAMSRILTKDEAKSLSELTDASTSQSNYYLELQHHPSLQSAKLSRDERGRLRPMLGHSVSIMSINEEHLKEIFNNLYTARFIVKNGFAHRYGSITHQLNNGAFLPRLVDVPDGTYEFYYGKAYEVKWQGITKELPPSHPLCKFSIDKVITLYNLGIEFDTRFSPSMKFSLNPSRYAYFRNGDLYLMGAAIIKKESQEMQSFLANEKSKQQAHNLQYPYIPFEDSGAPLLPDGSLDKEFVKKYGLTIPLESYLALGDNHAMSADSRDFGFVPESNLRGAPDVIFWPVGPRWGRPDQPPYPFFNLPRTVVWGCLSLIGGIYYLRSRRRNKLPIEL